MAARISVAEARRLGLDVPKKGTRSRKVAGGPYLTVCKTCGTEFRTVASEDRHLRDTHHARYDVICEAQP